MKWKFIHIYMVEADTRQEAIDRFVQAIHTNSVDHYFEAEIIKRVEEPTGWFRTLLKQVRGGRG